MPDPRMTSREHLRHAEVDKGMAPAGVGPNEGTRTASSSPTCESSIPDGAKQVAADAQPRLPRVLITGFSVFPGAPLNPTEKLVPLLAVSHAEGAYSGWCASLETEILPVEYEAVTKRLPALLAGRSTPAGEEESSAGHTRDTSKAGVLGTDCERPDIIIHFGLYSLAPGIQLERFARNECCDSPDNAGFCRGGVIDASGEAEQALPSSLPSEEIHRELEKKSIPVCWSDNAGGYLCNYTFYLSAMILAKEYERAGTSEGIDNSRGTRRIVGFVHVPPELDSTATGRGWLSSSNSMDLGKMKEAAEVILEQSCRAWSSNRRAA